MSLAIEVATPGSFDGLPTKKNFDRRFDWSCHSITTTFGTVTGQDRGEVVRGQAHSRPLTNERVLKNQTSLTPKIYRHQAFGLYSQWFSRATKHAQDKNSSGRPQLRPRKLDHLEPKFKKTHIYYHSKTVKLQILLCDVAEYQGGRTQSNTNFSADTKVDVRWNANLVSKQCNIISWRLLAQLAFSGALRVTDKR